MALKPDPPPNTLREKVETAINELGKGIKAVTFYPPGHPVLTQSIWKIITAIEDIPPPAEGLEIEVTKNALLYRDEPLSPGNKAIADFKQELYLRRASKLILLPGQNPQEMIAFLGTVTSDSQDLQDQGGLEKVLMRKKVSRIWVNRVDYEGLTEMLKREEESPGQVPEEQAGSDDSSSILESVPPEEMNIEEILGRLEKESDADSYRELVARISLALLRERSDLRIEYAGRALAIYVRHIGNPPGKSREIADHARMGIQELVSDDLVAHCIRRLRERGGVHRKEAETILAAFGDRAVKPLLGALAEEEDLLVRKTIIDIVVAIGPSAVPAILDNLQDSRWYVVRNMVTILGNLGIPDLAPHISSTLPHPDLRVKKEAIKGLSRLAHPSAVTALGELCFFPEETVALTATAALALKKEEEAVLTLYRRAVQKTLFFPHYRLAHEAIDSLRAIDTGQAIDALEEILRLDAIWETASFREMKKHALRSISRMSGDRPKEIVRRAGSASRAYLRMESERILKRTGW